MIGPDADALMSSCTNKQSPSIWSRQSLARQPLHTAHQLEAARLRLVPTTLHAHHTGLRPAMTSVTTDICASFAAFS